MAEDHGRKMGELISKAWSDEAFKKRLLSDTMAVLKENGITAPEGITVKAVENTDKVFHIVIPPKPSKELSDAELDKVAAGRGASWVWPCRVSGAPPKGEPLPGDWWVEI